LGADRANLLQKGANTINSIFGDKVDGLTRLLSGFSGIKSSSAGSLLSIAAPLLLGFLGKHAVANNLNASGLANLLSSQKENISHAIPAGLNLSSIFGDTGAAIHHDIKPTAAPAAHYTEDLVENNDGGLKWLLLVLLFVLLAAGAWYLFGKSSHHEMETTAVKKDSATTDELLPTAPSAGSVDTSGNYIYDVGKMVTIDLPNGAGSLTVGESSTENKLYKFLIDKNAPIDTVKGNWFEFTNLRFVTGGSKVDSISSAQLKDIVDISKGFPTATFKIGGYTDNTGDSAANVLLSQKRSEAVVAELIKLGASSKAITGAKGYGSEHPIGDNETVEGRAMNRRVAINVKSK